jgi:murein DD-endopeptidase MepM/ murein hydrolase activator NlpD
MWKSPFPESTVTGEYGTLSAYRKAKGMQPHSGRDFAPGADKVIPAVAAGTVRLLQWSNILGWVLVQDAVGVDGKTYYIGYAHLSCASHGINCKGPQAHGNHSPLKSTSIGDKKELGEPIGRVGNTGSASTGAHLHLTVSRTVKGVFGVTSAKLDPKVIILANSKGSTPKQTASKKEAVVESPQTIVTNKQTIVYACPHCKKELR